jgi:hypothetical protein
VIPLHFEAEEGGKEGRREGRREGGKEGGREGGREGGNVPCGFNHDDGFLDVERRGRIFFDDGV